MMTCAFTSNLSCTLTRRAVALTVCAWLGFLPPMAAGQSADAPAQTPAGAAARALDGEYRIASDDMLAVVVLQAPELGGSLRVSPAGDVLLPLTGAVPVAGLTTREAEERIRTAVAQYVRNPHVAVQVAEAPHHTVAVVGAVTNPGVFPVRGPRSVLEILSLASGVTADAGESVVVLRGDPAAPDGAAPAATIPLRELLESSDPRWNVPVRPGDVVKVTFASTVYVVGEVNRPGAFPMRNSDQLTVLRALALGEGLTATASRGDAVILRTAKQGERREITVNIGRILNARDADVPLEPDDVLFVPGSGARTFTRATIETLTRLLTFRPVF